MPSPNATVLDGVAATSASHAWAVGYDSVGHFARPLIERWNGEVWRVELSPILHGELLGVAAVSATDAWAVGHVAVSRHHLGTLIEHWNGEAWHVQPSPNLDGHLSAVAAVSATDAWAVGSYYKRGRPPARTLIEHWNGKAWHVQPSRNTGGPSKQNWLSAVAAASPRDAWAGGYYYRAGHWRTLIEHWNGKAWHVQASPKLGGEVYGMAAASPRDAWAVGEHAPIGHIPGGSLVERWNGKAWKRLPSPDPGPADWGVLESVTVLSPRNAWAVGFYLTGTARHQTLVAHWNGKAWQWQQSADPGGANNNQLCGGAAVSGRDAWAVGSYSNHALFLRWNRNHGVWKP